MSSVTDLDLTTPIPTLFYPFAVLGVDLLATPLIYCTRHIFSHDARYERHEGVGVLSQIRRSSVPGRMVRMVLGLAEEVKLVGNGRVHAMAVRIDL